MKKICIALCLTFILFFQLTSCITIPRSAEPIAIRYEEDQIMSIEVYDLGENGLGGYFGVISDEDAGIDHLEKDYAPIATVDTDHYADFISGIESLALSDDIVIVLGAMEPLYVYRDYTVKITYENGDYDILSRTCQFYASGEEYYEINYSCDETVWQGFIESYLGTE